MDNTELARDTHGMLPLAAVGGRPGPALMGAHTLLGNGVCNRDGDDLGVIKEFMIDMASGRVAYAVLSFGGILGMGDKLFAVPWFALTLAATNKRFVLNVSKDVLKDAPGFEKHQWPTMADTAWARSVHTFYGALVPVDAVTTPQL